MARRDRLVTDVLHCTSLVELTNALGVYTSAVAVLAPYVQGRLQLEECRLLSSTPGVRAVVAYGDFANRPVGQDIQALLEVGVAAVWTVGVRDSPEDLLLALSRTLASSRMKEIAALAERAFDDRQRMVLRWVLSPTAALTLRGVATSKNVSPRTLRRWFRYAPIGAGELMAWVRVLKTLAAMPSRDIALRSTPHCRGYSRADAFGRASRRLCHDSCGGADGFGSLSEAGGAFLSRLGLASDSAEWLGRFQRRPGADANAV